MQGQKENGVLLTLQALLSGQSGAETKERRAALRRTRLSGEENTQAFEASTIAGIRSGNFS